MIMLDLQSPHGASDAGLPQIMLRNKIAGVTGNAAVNVERFDSARNNPTQQL